MASINKNSKIQEFYDSRAKSYDDMLDLAKYKIPNWVKSKLDNFKATRVLDLACGNGNIGRFLSEKDSEIVLTGIDLSPKMIESANERGIYNDLLVHDLSSGLPAEILNKEFDLIIGLGFLEFLKEPKALLNQMASILAPKGRILCSIEQTTNESEPSGLIRKALGFPMFHYSKSEIKLILDSAEINSYELGELDSYIRSYDKKFVPWWMIDIS